VGKLKVMVGTRGGDRPIEGLAVEIGRAPPARPPS
jgi:hypothetical protein